VRAIDLVNRKLSLAFRHVLWASLLVCSCSLSQERECRRFVVRMNERLTELDRLVAEGTSTSQAASAKMRRIGDRYAELAREVESARFAEPEMRRLRDEYRTMLLEVSRLAVHTSLALERNDVAEAARAQAAFSEVVTREDALVAKINERCRAK